MNTAYEDWLAAITRPQIEESTCSLPDELELQSLWFRGAFGRCFTTADGQEVEVCYFGEWNHAAGPDFLECLITIDGVEHKGSIELDPSPHDWERHGHATNPAFDTVVLHVSFAPSGTEVFCRTSLHRNVVQVHLTDWASALEPHSQQVADTIPGYCSQELSSWSVEEVNRLLKSAAQHRLQQKASRLARQVAAIGLRETLWQALASVLGYRPNQQAMRLLSQRVKAHRLQSLGAMETRVAVLLGTAGFLTPEFYEAAPAETQDYLQQMWDEWWKLRTQYELSEERQISWTKHGQRPVNHPHRRVASLALLLPQLRGMQTALEHPTAQRMRELKKTMVAQEDSFWSHHYTLTSARAKSRLSLFGADKFKELLSNVMIPLWYLEDQEGAFNYYAQIRSTSSNDQVRRALGRLFPQHPAEIAQFTYQHQGLQQLYRDFCLRHGCLNCPFPKL